MPRVLLDLAAGSDRRASGRRRWYSVPASVAAHGVVILTIAALPLLSSSLPKAPSAMAAFLVEPVPPSPPPLPAPPRPAATRPVAPPNPNAAPVVVPEGVRPETGLERAATLPEATAAQAGVVVGPELGPPAEERIAAPVPTPTAPVRPGGDIEYPKKIVDVTPEYPPAARQAHIEGIVIIEATIGPDGAVTGARVLRSVPLLDRAALDAVSRWRYTPTRLNGVPVPVIITVTVRFALRQAP